MKITLPNGAVVNAEEVKDLDSYRGFYVIINGKNIKASFCTTKMEVKYSQGFKKDENISIEDHLYQKLKRKEILTENELIAFDEKVNRMSPGKFKDVLEKLVNLRYWVIDSKNLTDFERENLEGYDGIVSLDV